MSKPHATPTTFNEFVEAHKTQLKAISFEPGTPGFWDLVRLWNTIAMMWPERCENVVQLHSPDVTHDLVTTKNPWRYLEEPKPSTVKHGKQKAAGPLGAAPLEVAPVMAPDSEQEVAT